MQKRFIGGQWVAGSDGRTLPVVDPSTGEVFDGLAHGSADDIDRAVEAARADVTVAARYCEFYGARPTRSTASTFRISKTFTSWSCASRTA